MKWDALFWGSTTGNTRVVGESIAKKLDIPAYDISGKSVLEKIKDANSVVFGLSTWGIGDLQSDWEDILEDLKKVDFSEKTIAIFGLGDQESYSTSFVDGMRTVYDVITKKGAKVVGKTSTEGYSFAESLSVIDGFFVGLAIDIENQDHLSDGRIDSWCKTLREF
ncbi:flavodoxin [bacterium]|nr:flavodoxin [bacterium]